MKIEIKGPIIGDGEQIFYDWFGIPATSAAKVNNALNGATAGEDIEVIINSGGGSVFAGSEIYTALKSYPGKVTAKIVGLAASAASVASMGCSVIEMAPTAQMMIHNSACGNRGDKNSMRHTGNVLESIDESISMAYKIKTGKSEGELLDLMNTETWMSAKKAKEMGFIDKVMFEEETSFVNTAPEVLNAGTLPPEVIEKLRNEMVVDGAIKVPKSIENTVLESPLIVTEGVAAADDIELAKAKLKLKLKI